MLDWSKIDNEKIFQRLANHLFFLECTFLFGFDPFSPYIGKDGGWDGKYKGLYPPEGLSGIYCIQAKWTKHNLNEAMPSLRKWVKEELEKANKNNVQHLRLATSAELREEHINELEALNNNEVESFKIWARELLDLRINQQPFLRYFYFKSPSIPLFIPPSIYFKDVERNLFEESNIDKILTIKERFTELRTFLQDGNKKIFVIHAPGGYGKSHFLREIPRFVNSLKIDREVWFIRDGVRNIQQAFDDEIGVRESAKEKHKYVFVVDDADRADDIKEILLCIMKSGIDAKLVMSLRTAGKFTIEDILFSVKCMPITTMTSIPQWTDDDLKALLRAVAQKDTVQDEGDIVRRYPNPFFLVKIGLNIKGKREYDFEATRQAILQSLVNDAKQILSSEQVDIVELLLHLTLVAPINITYRSTIVKLAQKLKTEEERLIKILEKLVNGSVLRKIGNALRFIPDMIGDVFLWETMQSMDENLRKESFLYWFDTHSKNIFCNLGATLRYGDSAYLIPIVTDVISGWISNACKYDSYEKRRILENLEDICNIAPEKTIDLLWTFLDTPDLSTDAYGPIVVRLIHSVLRREEIVKIIEGLRVHAKQGTYDNYKPDTLVRETVTPLRNNIEKQIMPILDIVERSLKSTDPIIEFAKVALQEVLASAHEWSHSTYESIQFGSRALKATELVLSMRNKSIEIVKAMLLDSQPEVRLAAVDVVEDIGRCHFGPGISSEIPLKDKIIEERQEMIGFIENNNLVEKETNWQVLSSYEDLLFGWWACQDVPDDRVLPLLNKFNYDSEYRIYRYYTSRWDISDDVRDKLKDAPSKDRWPWAVDNIMQRKWHLTVENFEKDAISLSKKYPKAENIAVFLYELGKKITISSANALFLRAWFNQGPEAFRQIRLQKSLWNKIPLIFKYTITFDLVHKYPDIAKTIIDETLLTKEISIDESKIAIDILSYDLPVVDKYGIIKSVAEKKIDDLNLTIIERMRFIGDKIPAKKMAEIVLIVLKHLSPEASPKSIDHIAFILHGKNKDYIETFLEITRDVIYSTLLSDGKLDYHDFEIASLMFSSIEGLMAFIEKRLEQENTINKYSEYEAVPFRGIDFIDKIIRNAEDYFYGIQKVLEWDEKYEGIASYSVTKVFEQIILLKDETGNLYINSIKDKFYNQNLFPKYLNCLFRLPLNQSNIAIFSEAIQKSKELNSEDEMAKLLKSKIYPEGGWSSSVGQVPPAFIEKKEVFQSLKNNAPAGVLRNSLDECIRGAEKMIEEHREEEENRFHSR